MRPEEDPAYELLGLLGEELAAGDLGNRVVPADGIAPAQLVVPLTAEDGTTATVHVCFLPEHDVPPVLQYIVVLDHEVAPDAVDTTARFLHMLNTSLPLTGFELGETAAAVVFRHLQAVSIQPLVPEVVLWPLSMIYHAVTHYDGLIGQACTGTPLVDLVSGFGRVQAALFAPVEVGS